MASEFLVYLRLGFEHIADPRGYDHILSNVVPMLRQEGFGDSEIDDLLRNNPARLLSAE